MADELLRERRGQVEILTINRPDARNAVNARRQRRSRHRPRRARPTTPTRPVVVLTGSGDKAFSAGMDLKAFAAGEGAAVLGAPGGFGGVTRRDFPKPLIAAVNGSALAGGFEIVLACDLVVAADHATFGIPEAKRGLIAAAGGLLRLPKRLPLAVALELALTGDPIDAERALALGLVNRRRPARPAARRGHRAGRPYRRERAALRPALQGRHLPVRHRPRGRGLGDQRRGDGRRLLLRRRHGGPGRLRREAAAELAGPVDPGLAGLAAWVTGRGTV